MWVDVIGPHLEAKDLVFLSMVNRWGHYTAHCVTSHCGYIKLEDNTTTLDTYQQMAKFWPYLKLELEFHKWSFEPPNPPSSSKITLHQSAMETIGRTPKLTFKRCAMTSFQILDATRTKELFLHDIRLEMPARLSLGKYLDSASSLMSLTISGNNDFETGGSQWLGAPLAKLTQLTYLDLCNNGFREGAAQHLAYALVYLTRLTVLKLGWNHFGPEGMRRMAPSIGLLVNLTSLDLNWNGFRASGAQHVSESLSKLTQLTTLELTWNDLGAIGAQHLVEPLTKLTKLTYLDIYANRFGDLGVRCLIESLALLPLTHLDMSEMTTGLVSPDVLELVSTRLSHVKDLRN
eukprot:c208_g1_i1.p1 GENE.c208_g1_i1~~c208_g1_i1.p1  ORF type:complete len:381 (+),score=93.23 c208_g1_i1:103-1143(+)